MTPVSRVAVAADRAVRSALRGHLPSAASDEPRLRAALRQGALHPGKLLRGRLVWIAARRHGLGAARAGRLAAAVEYYHTASLLLDDLPCMDDATLRRGQPCVHRAQGEATAILAALALINRAYALVGEAFVREPALVRRRVTTLLDRSLGLAGLVGGQAWDLAFARSARSPALVGRIAAGKTGALLALALELPVAAARLTDRERRALRALGVYWGQLYQAIDDLADLRRGDETGKTSGRDRLLARPNLALAVGLPAAQTRVTRLERQARRALAALRTGGGARWDYLWTVHASLVRPAALVEEVQHHAA